MRVIRLDAPDGTVIVAPANGSTSVSGYTSTTISTSVYAKATIDFPPGKGAGTWTVTSDPPVSSNDMAWCVLSGIHLERLDPSAAPAAGGEQSVAYHAVDSAGNVNRWLQPGQRAERPACSAATDSVILHEGHWMSMPENTRG